MTYSAPDTRGRYGPYGGQFVPETLMHALTELDAAYKESQQDPSFQEEVRYYLENYVGRENPLYFAERLTKHYGKAKIYLKREDLNHTGAHKINNTVGQALLAKRMGKKKVVAETGAGQHGVATATVSALFGLECTIFMGKEDIRRQQLNVFRMELLGAKVVEVTQGSGTLKDAVNEALRYWVTHVEDTHYIMGSVLGPHPFPQIVRDYQSVIGQETRRQSLTQFDQLPTHVIACIGGGSNAMGMFYPFIQDETVKLIGVEAAGHGVASGKHAASLTGGKVGVLHGAMMHLLQDEAGQIQEAHSISAGLDYPGIGPEHSYLHDLGRVEYTSVTDEEALTALQLLAQTEGIIPALESAHALAHLETLLSETTPEDHVVICLSGRGDKDVHTIREALSQKEDV
ncbi:tryptophan synthase subunit beta [Chryseomicrobium excrementi]|uniref:Tryptophan synthase beta chain n=1 Tax=Chryseomicrobium excrementi TaxID=2041346 RepID=A0A2M9EXU8_9BACL|nr:tryptophan synthase subunit beta [Chryseomicrobium excrementi]PJK16044.1 tryptophan synthase subunit beta [Chryseomicrobium excrementi]